MKKANALQVRKKSSVRGKLKLVTSSLNAESESTIHLPQAPKPQRKPRADEMRDSHMDDLAEKSQLMAYMNSGMSAQEALALVPMRAKRSVSWAQKLFRAYKEDGPQALVDGRWLRTTEAQIMKPEVKKLIDFFLLDIPAAGPTAIWKEVCKECKERNLEEPSCSSVKQYIASLPEPIKLLRKGKRGLRQWDRNGRPVIRYENTTYSNERWQVDDCHLPMWARRKENGVWKPCYVFYTGSLDAESRSIPGFIASSRNPDAWTVKLLLRACLKS